MNTNKQVESIKGFYCNIYIEPNIKTTYNCDTCNHSYLVNPPHILCDYFCKNNMVKKMPLVN